jgi:lipoprotein-releasing system permease protein
MNRWAPFEWITAIRFLKEGRMQTVFIITGISIGVAVIVFMSVMLTSLQSNFVRRVLTSQPHIQIIPPDEVARALRPVEAGLSLATTIQRPTQRLRSIDQWQSVTAQLIQRPLHLGACRTGRRQSFDLDDRHRSAGLLQDRQAARFHRPGHHH